MAIAVLYAWPLLSNLTRSFPGTSNDRDVATMVWNVGWIDHQLSTGGDVLSTSQVLIPFGADLRLHTYGLLQGLMAYPWVGWLGIVGAYNLMLILTLFLNGGVTYLLIQHQVKQPAAALIASAWLMLASPIIFQLDVGRPAFGSIWIVSGALLAFQSLLDRPRLWKGALLGSLLLAALFTDFQIVLFSVIWLALVGSYRLWQDRRAFFNRDRMSSLVLAILIFTIPFALIYYPSLVTAASASYPQPGLSGMLDYSFRLQDYFDLNTMPLVFGYELIVCALMATLIFRGRGEYRFWLLGAVVILSLALGPFLNPTHIPLPFALLSKLWPPLGQFRTPGRLAMPAQIGLTLVAGLVLAHLFTRIRSKALIGGILLLAIAGRLAFAVYHDPFKVQTYPDYSIYHQIANERDDFSILEVPFGIRSGLDAIGQGGEVLEYYQFVHGKKIFNAMIARLPTSVFDFYRQSPALLFLSGLTVQTAPIDLDRDLATVLRWSSARYVLVHRSLLTADQSVTIQSFLDRQPALTQVGTEADLVIYRASP